MASKISTINTLAVESLKIIVRNVLVYFKNSKKLAIILSENYESAHLGFWSAILQH